MTDEGVKILIWLGMSIIGALFFWWRSVEK